MKRHLITSAAIILIIIGFMLMTGEGSSQAAFSTDIFSTRRIVVAPVLCLTGYLLMIAGIIWRK